MSYKRKKFALPKGIDVGVINEAMLTTLLASEFSKKTAVKKTTTKKPAAKKKTSVKRKPAAKKK
mgnify:CR=1 FL=1